MATGILDELDAIDARLEREMNFVRSPGHRAEGPHGSVHHGDVAGSNAE